jgi:hypothetical protein
MSSGLILKMNNGYNEVSRELENNRVKCSCVPCLKGRGAFYRPGGGRITMK